MKLSNVKHLKTTIMGIVGGLLIIAGFIWPDKVNAETGEVINEAVGQVISGIGALIPIIAAILAKDD